MIKRLHFTVSKCAVFISAEWKSVSCFFFFFLFYSLKECFLSDFFSINIIFNDFSWPTIKILDFQGLEIPWLSRFSIGPVRILSKFAVTVKYLVSWYRDWWCPSLVSSNRSLQCISSDVKMSIKVSAESHAGMFCCLALSKHFIVTKQLSLIWAEYWQCAQLWEKCKLHSNLP